MGESRWNRAWGAVNPLERRYDSIPGGVTRRFRLKWSEQRCCKTFPNVSWAARQHKGLRDASSYRAVQLDHARCILWKSQRRRVRLCLRCLFRPWENAHALHTPSLHTGHHQLWSVQPAVLCSLPDRGRARALPQLRRQYSPGRDQRRAGPPVPVPTVRAHRRLEPVGVDQSVLCDRRAGTMPEA